MPPVDKKVTLGLIGVNTQVPKETMQTTSMMGTYVMICSHALMTVLTF
jgi:hypothetical protein